MVLAFFFFTSLVLGFISYEDIRYRRLDVRTGGFLFLIGCVFHYLFLNSWIAIVLNTGFIISLLLFLMLYYAVKDRSLSNPLKDRFGKGDSFFFIAVTPFFLFENFMIFIISGMIICLLQHVVINFVKPVNTIPLAGYLSNYIILLLILDLLGLQSLINVYK